MSLKKDPKYYYRSEAREIIEGMSAELLAISRGEERADAPARLFRLAHTLKGAATVVGDASVVEIARILEDVLAVHRDTNAPLAAQEITEFLQMVEALDGFLAADAAALASPAESKGDESPSPEPAQDAHATVRVELEDLDDVTASLSGAELQSSSLHLLIREMDSTSRALEALIEQSPRLSPQARVTSGNGLGDTKGLQSTVRELLDRLTRTRRVAMARADSLTTELRQARERVTRLELVPAANVFPALERATQLAASTVGKSVRFETRGGDVRVDRRILPVVGEALLHLVRNAVDHGIESAHERERLGKPTEGRLTLSVQPRGSKVAFICEDDGAGIDPALVRSVAVERGFMPESEAALLDDSAALRLLFRAGVSTRRQVTDLSGRGVGLDVVGNAATTLRGETTLTSLIGSGTRVEICVPLSLATAKVVALRVENTTVLLPLDSVRRVFRIAPGALLTTHKGESVLHDGEMLPALRLGPALGITSRPLEGTSLAVLEIAAGSQRCAVVADAALGHSDVIVRPLPWAVGAPMGIAGAVLDAESVPKLVLDARGLLAILQHHGGVRPDGAGPTRARRVLPILVIDDSLTTRMLEQSILQTAGFEVDVACSAEEGLGMARAREYGLFVVDVEMPGMNGFEFTRLTRSDSQLGRVAVVLVTSLNSEADKRRGREAGAAAYVVKGQFDQNQFLDQVRTLSRAEV